VTEEITSQRTTVVAFYSSADESGRSCMVANLALMLASQGQRVLVIDLDLATPSLYRYLSAFLPGAPSDAGIDSPVHLSCEFDHPAGIVDFVGPVRDKASDPRQFTVSRADILRHGYDIVLIDLPASEEAAGLARDLAEFLVLGYTLNWQHIDRATQLARAVGGKIRVLPVPMRVENAVQATAQRRLAARRQFTQLLGNLTEEQRQHYWNEVEIPYEAEYSVEEALPFLDPDSAHRDRLVAAFQRLARQLVPGMAEATSSGATSQTLVRYRDARRAAAGQDNTVTILHAAADRHWGEWLAAALKSMGLTTVRRRIDQAQGDDLPASSKMIVVSANLLRLPGLGDLLRQVTEPRHPNGVAPVSVSVDGRPLPDLLPAIGIISLARRGAKEAYEALRSYYQIGGSPLPPRDQFHFPAGRETTTVNLPVRGHTAAGRDDLIDQVRDHFTTRTAPPALALTGPAGMGKTLVALEYARRFGTDYDLIVLIRADSTESIRADLAELATRMPPRQPAGDAVAAMFEELQSAAAPAKRWLLIYAGADDPSLLGGHLPESAHGHVLLTSRVKVPAGAVSLTVPALAEVDAEAVVSGQVEGIRPLDAAWVARHMRGIPLALRLACTWLRITMSQAAERDVSLATLTEDAVLALQAGFAEAAGSTDAAVSDPVEPVVNLHLAALKLSDLGEAALLLLETCAFLGSCGLSWRLLGSREMLAQLVAASPQLTDPIMLPSVIQEIASRGLLLLDDTTLIPGDMSRAPLRVHPRVLDVVRARLTDDEREARKRQVSKMLAVSVPQSVDDDVIKSGGIYAELLQHVRPSGAIDQLDDAVREWLVNLVRFMWQADNHASWEAAAELGERLAARWRSGPSGDEPDRPNDLLLLRLGTQLGNVYRSLGQFARARKMDEDVLAKQRQVLGLRHPRTLMTAYSYGADLRLVGDFEGALLEDSASWQATIQSMGREHPLAIIASGNLALSELLAGDVEQALQRRLEHDLPWCERFDEERPWETAWVLSHIGALQRELGRYQESLDSLKGARDGFRRAAGGISPPSSVAGLRVDAGIAIAERRLGSPNRAATLQALDNCRKIFGDAHPLVPAIMLSQAGDAQAAGEPAEAVRLASDALERHVACFTSDHPFVWVNQVDLSNYALAAGNLALAEEALQVAHASLQRVLGPSHLWTLAASIAQANVLAVTGDLDAAISLEERVLEEYKERLGADHPFTRVARANLRHSSRLRNEQDPAADPVGLTTQRASIELDIPPH
jgi:tetratricopeptide (TPR) repeat protein